jgi:hypothetical protein
MTVIMNWLEAVEEYFQKRGKCPWASVKLHGSLINVPAWAFTNPGCWGSLTHSQDEKKRKSFWESLSFGAESIKKKRFSTPAQDKYFAETFNDEYFDEYFDECEDED